LLTSELLARYNLSVTDIKETLFDRLNQSLPETCKTMLDTQYRMVPEIGGLISTCFYGQSLNTGRSSSEKQWLIEFLKRPVIWFSTSALDHKHEKNDGNSYRNQEECRCIKTWLLSLDEQAVANQTTLTVGVISGYSAQVRLLSEELGVVTPERISHVSQWKALDITVNTVDAIQGREVDIVVYSVARSNVNGTIGHLRMHNRLNVALSRGKEGLVIFGDVEHCYTAKDTDNPFPRVIDYIRSNPDTCLEIVL